jgi:hypothetical protein
MTQAAPRGKVQTVRGLIAPETLAALNDPDPEAAISSRTSCR